MENGRRRSRRLGTLARMTDPVRVIADSVRTRARRGTLVGAPEEAVQEELRRYAEHAFASDAPLIADERRAERQIVADLTGFGQLQPLLDDPAVEEIWINSPPSAEIRQSARVTRWSRPVRSAHGPRERRVRFAGGRQRPSSSGRSRPARGARRRAA